MEDDTTDRLASLFRLERPVGSEPPERLEPGQFVIWGGALTAEREDTVGVIEQATMATVLGPAENPQAAYDAALRKAYEWMPVESGWFDHRVSVAWGVLQLGGM